MSFLRRLFGRDEEEPSEKREKPAPRLSSTAVQANRFEVPRPAGNGL